MRWSAGVSKTPWAHLITYIRLNPPRVVQERLECELVVIQSSVRTGGHAQGCWRRHSTGHPLCSGNSLRVHYLGFDGRESSEHAQERQRDTAMGRSVSRAGEGSEWPEIAQSFVKTRRRSPSQREWQRAHDMRREMGPEMGAQDEPGSLGRRHPCGLCARIFRLPSWGPGPESSAGSSRPSGLGGQGRDAEGRRAGNGTKGRPTPCSPPTPMVDVTGDSDRQRSWRVPSRLPRANGRR